MIEYLVGDLAEAPERVIVHGCNAQGKMASGVAKVLRDKWPEIFPPYEKWLRDLKSAKDAVGTICPVPVGDKIIVNAITQEFYGRETSRLYVSYDGMREVIQKLNEWAPYWFAPGQERRIAMPLIGAGLANGSWSIISKIIEEEADAFQPVVYTLEPLPTA